MTHADTVHGQTENSSKPRLYSLDAIKALGIFLVINSHLDGLYKNSFHAGGGALGNTLFFLASGIGLGYGWAHNRPNGFVAWYKRRVLRIYPSLTILNIIFVAFTFKSFIQQPLVDVLSFIVYPTAYFFIAAIMLFYIPGYFLLRFGSTRELSMTLLASIGIYIAWYCQLNRNIFSIEGDGYFRWVYYFIVFTTGLIYVHFKSRPEKLNSTGLLPSKMTTLLSRSNAPALVISIFLLAAIKIIIRAPNSFALNFQFLIHLLYLLIAWLIFVACEKATNTIIHNRLAWSLASFLSPITLELYLIDRYAEIYIKSANDLIYGLDLNLPFEFKSRIMAVAILWFLLIVQAVALLKLTRKTTKFLFSY